MIILMLPSAHFTQEGGPHSSGPADWLANQLGSYCTHSWLGHGRGRQHSPWGLAASVRPQGTVYTFQNVDVIDLFLVPPHGIRD